MDSAEPVSERHDAGFAPGQGFAEVFGLSLAPAHSPLDHASTHSSGESVAVAGSIACFGSEGSGQTVSLIEELNRIAARDMEFDGDTFVGLAGQGEKELMKLYLRAGMPVDVLDSRGYNAATAAARAGKILTLEFLAENGLDLGAADGKNRTPYQAARLGNQRDTAEYLKLRVKTR